MLRQYLSHISFDKPEAFALLALLPIAFVIALRKENKRTATFRFSNTAPIGSKGSSLKTKLRNLPVFFRIAALAVLIVALARPARYQNIEITRGEGIDIVLCLDVSGSMLARDFEPDRFRASINVAREFVSHRKGDRMGLVIFSGQSLALCPLTTDLKVITDQLGRIEYGILSDGTAIGTGLASAVDRLRSGNAKSKVVILLTDGENTGGLIDPPTAKELAKTYGIKVYTIGVGTTGYAPMPYQTPDGSVSTRQEKVSIDEPLLTQIAQETGGQYFRANNKQALEEIYRAINGMEKSKVETTVFKKRTDEFFPWVMMAIVLMIVEVLLRWSVFRKFP